MRVCNGNELLINRYLDGDLTGDEEISLCNHLETCPACRLYYEQLGFIGEQLNDIEYPPQLHASIMAAVDEVRGRGKVRRFKLPAYIGAVAAVLAIALVGAIGLGRGGFGIPFRSKDAAYEGASNEAVGTDALSYGLKAALEAPMAADAPADAGNEDRAAATQESKAAADVPGEVYVTVTPPEEMEPVTIEQQMLSWFNDDSDNVTVLNLAQPHQTDGEPADSAEDVTLPEVEASLIAHNLGDALGGYGFYMVACGEYERLPAIFAELADGIELGMTLLVSVNNSDSVMEEIAGSMTESGFEIYTDTDSVYFNVDRSAEEGLVIIDLGAE